MEEEEEEDKEKEAKKNMLADIKMLETINKEDKYCYNAKFKPEIETSKNKKL